MTWETPDIRDLLNRLQKMRAEATTSANAGAYPVPLGQGRLLRKQTMLKGYEKIIDLLARLKNKKDN